MTDAFFTTATTEFLREQRKKSEEAIAAHREQLKRAEGDRALSLKHRLLNTEAHIESIDEELKRRGMADA